MEEVRDGGGGEVREMELEEVGDSKRLTQSDICTTERR